jgi:hypothetical protein
MFYKLFIFILLAIMCTACAKQAAFVSIPSGAQVFVDGRAIGVTPCKFDYKLSQNVSHNIKIAKEGFESVDFVVVADEVDTVARDRWLVAGAVWSPLWLGTMFTNKLKDTYDFALLPEAPQVTAAVSQPLADKDM